jgi:ankyrin repeat protein
MDLIEMIDLLIDKKANVDSIAKVGVKQNTLGRFDIRQATPLMYAIYNNNRIMVNKLIAAGCNPNYQDPYSKISAIHMACYLSSFDILNSLLERGINLDVYIKSKGM